MSVNKCGDASTCELDDQFILRLPPRQAKVVRKILRKKPKKLKKRVSIELEDDLRHGVVQVRGKYLHAKLLDLPAIVESNKTVDGAHLFKTADVCQMLVCQEDEFERVEELADKTFKTPHGYAPPMKNARKFRFRKTLHNKGDAEEAADIEKEVLWLLRMDNEAVSTKYEFVCDNKTNKRDVAAQPVDEINELSIFGEELSDLESDEGPASGSASSCDANDIMYFTN